MRNILKIEIETFRTKSPIVYDQNYVQKIGIGKIEEHSKVVKIVKFHCEML